MALAWTGICALTGCAAEPEETVPTAADMNLDENAAKISFKADWSEVVKGQLRRGAKVAIDFDERRVPCNAGNHQPNYQVLAHYRFNGGAIKTERVAGFIDGMPHGSITLADAGDLEMWFENSSDFGCHAWDSNLGANYHFHVGAAAVNPDWAGEARFVTSRGTCDGTYCEPDLRAITETIHYDSWVRQRAAVRLVTFEAWKEGVTDRPDGGASLDARIFARNGSRGAFTGTSAVFDKRAGNNARFSVDLRALDPLGDYVFPTTRAQCPSGITKESVPGGALAVVDVQFYMQVGNKEIRPADGTVFHARYEQDAGRYAVCFAP